jgi:hypothetical protein
MLHILNGNIGIIAMVVENDSLADDKGVFIGLLGMTEILMIERIDPHVWMKVLLAPFGHHSFAFCCLFPGLL